MSNERYIDRHHEVPNVPGQGTYTPISMNLRQDNQPSVAEYLGCSEEEAEEFLASLDAEVVDNE